LGLVEETGSSFGVVVRANEKNEGYIVGVGSGWNRTTGISYLDGWWGTNDLNGRIAEGRPFDPGTDWHTYRVEVQGNAIKLLIDGAVMASVRDNRYLSGGDVGLWSNRYQLEVRSFKVIKL
jgi:hypothetical protein